MIARLHFVGICGKAMGAIAIALADAGHVVTGSDEQMYPPMPGLLRDAGIDVSTPFAAANLPASLDVVVTGRRLVAGNPELQAAAARRVPCLSFPELLRDWFLDRSQNLVVAGGVGKTTTAAMLAWILEHEGQRPDYVIGGVSAVLGRSARLRGAEVCVLEGDEYASAVDDPTPKFLHYRPDTLAITNTLDDHPDLYPDRASLLDAFSAAIRLLPSNGALILSDTDPGTSALRSEAACEITIVGEQAPATGRIADVDLAPRGSSFSLRGQLFSLRLFGRMNIRNAAMAALVAERVGVPLARASVALAAFTEVSNRQERTECPSVTLIRDKATHPASIVELHMALRQQFPRRHLVVVIRPRATGGREWIYQRDLPAALVLFDRVLVTVPYEHRPPSVTRWQTTPFSPELLAAQTRALGADLSISSGQSLAEDVRAFVTPDDVVLLLLPESHVEDVVAVTRALASP